MLDRGRESAMESTSVANPKELKPYPQWDGLVKLDPDEAKNSGLLVVAVQPQAQPIKLDLPGRTAYDPNSLNKVRPRFDTLVEKVYVELGQKVKKGDPLVDLFSTDLAAAKNDFQTAYVQWQHDLTLRTLREKLFKNGSAISEQLLIDYPQRRKQEPAGGHDGAAEALGVRGSRTADRRADQKPQPCRAPRQGCNAQFQQQGEDDAALAGRRDRGAARRRPG